VPEGPDGQRFEVWVDARRPARASVAAASFPAALPLDEPASVGAGETATVHAFGFRDGGTGRASDRDAGATVTLDTERDGRRYETTVRLTR
jgi:hypothetical protein